MADTSQQELSEPHTNGAVDGLTEEEKSKMRPADIDADMREMERRKRVEMMVNSRLFREELERIIETQMKDGAGPSGLLQQISDMMGAQGARFNGNVFKNSNCVVPINDIRGVESMGYAKGEKLLRCKLAAVFRLLDLYGWTQGVGGMITARLNQDQEHFLVNPYGLLYHEVTASSLVKVDMQGAVVEQGTTNFGVHITGFQLHSTIHAARPDIKCIIHITTPSVTAISSLKCGLLPVGQESIVIGEVSTHQYVGGSFEPEEREKITRNLGPMNKVMLLTNRGALCCGETVEEAFFNVYNTVLACETQLKLMPAGIDNISLISEESKKAIYEASRKPPIPQHSSVAEPSPLAEKLEKRWRIGGTEFEALMRMLDNAGFRTGYIYRHPLVKGEPPRPKNDVEVPPAVSSLGYLLEEEELYKQGLWKGGRKGTDRSRWLNSPNVYQKVEILETGTPDPKKITKWVSDGSPTHSSTPVKIDSALQFVPKNTNPKEFKQIQQQIKDYRRADKISAGPQSHILEGVTWEEAKKMQDATISGTGEQVVLVGAASKGIIQRGFQHNAMVYKTPYAKNPFDAVTDQELDQYKKEVERKQKGDIYDESQSESEALSSFNISRATHESSTAKSPIQSPVSVTSETEEESRDEPRVLRIETKQVPAPSQPEVVLSDDCGLSSGFSSESEELARYEFRDLEVGDEPLIALARSTTLAEPLKPRFTRSHYNHDPQGLARDHQARFFPQARKTRLAIKSSIERRRDFFENYEKRMLSNDRNKNNKPRECMRALNGVYKAWKEIDLLNKKNAGFQPTSVYVATTNQDLFLRNTKTLNIDSVKFNAALNTYPIPESVYFAILRNKNVNVNVGTVNENLDRMGTESLIYSLGKCPQMNYVERVSLSLDDNRDYRANTIQDEMKESDKNGNDVQASRGVAHDNRSVDFVRSDINGNVPLNINVNARGQTGESKDLNSVEIDENGNSYKENNLSPKQAANKVSETKSLFDLVNYIKDNLHSSVNNIEESLMEKPEIPKKRYRENEITRSKSDGDLQENESLRKKKVNVNEKREMECLVRKNKTDEVKEDVEDKVFENNVDDAKDLIISGSCSISFKNINTDDNCRNSKCTERSSCILQSYISDSCLLSKEKDNKNRTKKKGLPKNCAGESAKCLIHMYCSDSCLVKKTKGICRQDSITDVINSINANIAPSKTTVDVLPETEISSKYNLDSTNMSLIYSLTLSADQCSSKNTSVDLENGSLEQSLEWQSDYAEKSVSSEGSLEHDDSDYIWLDLLMTSTKRESTPTPEVDLNETRELFDSSVDLGSQVDDEAAGNRSTRDYDNLSNEGSDILELPAKTVLELKEIGGETFRSDISSVVDEIIDEINVAEVCLKAANVVDDICESVAAMNIENGVLIAGKDLTDSQGIPDNSNLSAKDFNAEKPNAENTVDVTSDVIVIDEIVHHIVDNFEIRKSDSESSGEAHVKKRTKETTNAELKEMGINPNLQIKSEELEKLNTCLEKENDKGTSEFHIVDTENDKDIHGRMLEEPVQVESNIDTYNTKCDEQISNLESEQNKVSYPLMTSVSVEENKEEVWNFISSNEEVSQNDFPVNVDENASYSSSVKDEVIEKPLNCPCLQCKSQNSSSKNEDDSEGLNELSCSCEECKERMQDSLSDDNFYYLSNSGEDYLEASFTCDSCKVTKILFLHLEEMRYLSERVYKCSVCRQKRKSRKKMCKWKSENLQGNTEVSVELENASTMEEENRTTAILQDDEIVEEKEEEIVSQTREINNSKSIDSTDAVLEFFSIAKVSPRRNDLRLNFIVERAINQDQENVFLESDNTRLRDNKESSFIVENIDQVQDNTSIEKMESYYRGMSRYASTMKLDKLEEEPIEANLHEESVTLSEGFPAFSTSLQVTEADEQLTYSRYNTLENVKPQILPAIYEESDESMEISDESGKCFNEKIPQTLVKETRNVLRERYPSYIDLSTMDFDRTIRTPESPKSTDYFSCSSGQLKSQRNSGNSKESAPEGMDGADIFSNSREELTDENSDHLNSTYTISDTSSNERQFDEPTLAEYNADLSTNMDETRWTRQRNSDSSMSEVNLKINGDDDSTSNFADVSTNIFLSPLENSGSKKTTKSNKKHNKKSKRVGCMNIKKQGGEIMVDEMNLIEDQPLPEVEENCSEHTADPMAFSYDTQEFIRLEKAVAENSELLTIPSEVD